MDHPNETPTVATISSLPNELLAAIAAAGREDRVQWALSHVSHRFQTVMVGTPELWAFVQVDFRSEGSVKILQLYLQRSQTCPISATLQHRSSLDQASEDLIVERLAQIIRHINRISWLRIEVGNLGAEFLLAPFRDLTALNLEHLEVVNLIRYQWGPIELFSCGAPGLRFLKLYHQKLQYPPPQWVASLTHLELRHHRRGIALDATLGQCSMLVHLFLDLSFTKLERRARLPFLKSLFLVVPWAEDDFDLLATVTVFDTPSLAECAIDGVHGDQIFDLLSATSPADVSFPALTAFSFVNTHTCPCERNMTFPDMASPPSFQLFPALSSLSLVNICFSANLLKGVAVPTSDAWPVLGTAALSPRVDAFEGVRDVVLDAMHAHRLHGLRFPTFRLSPAFLNFEDWQEHSIDVKSFEPADVIQFFRSC
ncbi:hypothetical protein MSAN_01929100 [Mycena sanguinolenta]|uniref:F-box domain-containing protein n=1 Tax=Mycena sanguinolenta TaxID=230812 RepID=A0A8H6XPP7_9AGAR|nr:hypothetical protein MSAN_01929100 [Mycena sanguinolenta]